VIYFLNSQKEQSMHKLFKIPYLILITFSLIACIRQPVQNLELNQNWQFKQTGTEDWLPANIPGCIHTALFDNGIINDPFFGDNEQNLQWIGKTDWEYKSVFFANDEFLESKHIELGFAGLDTYAKVYLNDSLILTANNMFRKWDVDCKNYLITGKNELFVKFESPVTKDSLKAASLPYKLPDNRAITRKAPYQYGWDWGPKFVTQGIWKPVYLRTWNDARIKNIQVVQDSIINETAWLTSNFEIESSKEQDCFLTLIDEDSREIKNKIRVRLNKGTHLYPITFSIENPQLWWTNGLGDQHLYKFKYRIQTNGSIDEYSERIGIRTIELVQEPDSIGESFYFKLNGVPVFMKGANYIPQDNFPSRVSEKKYRQTIQSAVDANMNMLRVWGGGFYENDIFYDLCDENGILVWQDFMFACNLYPGDEAFVENVKQEAIQNVKRLRNHPSLGLWCGNNEVDEAWFNWGWQKSLCYSKEDSIEVRSNYLKIFESLLPEVISEFDQRRAYWPSSPKQGWGHEQALYSGDMHYWGVWWGEEPFEMYEEKIGRFMSEYGFQGFPDLRTLDSCLLPEDKNLQSQALLNHQKHPRGMELIRTYMDREFDVPDKFEEYIYVSQLVQAYGIKTAIEAHRRAKPYCMGTLYWQLNDCWPVISWSSVDYYNRWKALHYFVKNAYDEFLISFEEKNDSVKVFVVSDKLQSINAELEMKIIDFKGEEYWSDKQIITIDSNSSNIYFKKEINGFSKKDHLFLAKLVSNGKILASNIYYFLPVRDLQLPEPNIQKEIIKTEKGYQIVLKTDKLAMNVFLSVDRDGFFSVNYFDLLPGEVKRITYIPDKEIDSFESEIKVVSIFDTL